jgi:hypothetical protein
VRGPPYETFTQNNVWKWTSQHKIQTWDCTLVGNWLQSTVIANFTKSVGKALNQPDTANSMEMLNTYLWCLNGFLCTQLLGCTEIFDVAERVIITAQQQVCSFDRGAELGGVGNGAGGAQLDRQREESLVH